MRLPCNPGDQGSAQDNTASDVAPVYKVPGVGLDHWRMVRPVGTDASELLRNWRLLGLAGHEPSGAKVIPLVVLRRQVLCQVRYIVPL